MIKNINSGGNLLYAPKNNISWQIAPYTYWKMKSGELRTFTHLNKWDDIEKIIAVVDIQTFLGCKNDIHDTFYHFKIKDEDTGEIITDNLINYEHDDKIKTTPINYNWIADEYSYRLEMISFFVRDILHTSRSEFNNLTSEWSEYDGKKSESVTTVINSKKGEAIGDLYFLPRNDNKYNRVLNNIVTWNRTRWDETKNPKSMQIEPAVGFGFDTFNTSIPGHYVYNQKPIWWDRVDNWPWTWRLKDIGSFDKYLSDAKTINSDYDYYSFHPFFYIILEIDKEVFKANDFETIKKYRWKNSANTSQEINHKLGFWYDNKYYTPESSYCYDANIETNMTSMQMAGSKMFKIFPKNKYGIIYENGERILPVVPPVYHVEPAPIKIEKIRLLPDMYDAYQHVVSNVKYYLIYNNYFLADNGDSANPIYTNGVNCLGYLMQKYDEVIYDSNDSENFIYFLDDQYDASCKLYDYFNVVNRKSAYADFKTKNAYTQLSYIIALVPYSSSNHIATSDLCINDYIEGAKPHIIAEREQYLKFNRVFRIENGIQKDYNLFFIKNNMLDMNNTKKYTELSPDERWYGYMANNPDDGDDLLNIQTAGLFSNKIEITNKRNTFWGDDLNQTGEVIRLPGEDN